MTVELEVGGKHLKLKERTMSQGMQVGSRRCKRQGNRFSPEASRRNSDMQIP